MTTPDMTTNTDFVADEYVMENTIWYLMTALIGPVWDAPKGTAPVTSFDWAPALQALQRKEGWRSRPAAITSKAIDTADLVAQQAQRMAVEHNREQARLAIREKERVQREEEGRRQAQKDLEQVGDFGL